MRPHRPTLTRTILAITGSAALAIGLAACGDGGNDDESPTGEETSAPEDAPSDDATDEPTDDTPTDEDTTDGEAGETPGLEDVPTAEVGDCLVIAELVASGGEGITELPIVDCAEDHDAQVFAVIDMADGTYPGDEAVQTEMSDGCTAAFEGFVGVTLEESELEADGLSPSAETWAVGDREIICLAFYPDLRTTNESFEGAGV